MRYLVYGYYGHANFGDDLLLKGVVDGIRARDADAEFLVHSRDDVRGYEGDRRVRFTGLARRLEGVRARPWRALGYLLGFARCLERVDVLVVGGGTLFIDKGRVNLSLVLLLAAEWYARLRRRKVVVIGVAVDELTNTVTRWASARILAGAAYVAVRDDISLSYTAHLPAHRIVRAADLVFGFDVPALPPAPVRQRPVIGLCFIDYFGTVEPSAARRSDYENAVLGTIAANIHGYDFASIVLQRGVGQRDDWLEPALSRRHPEIRVHDLGGLAAAARAFAEVDAVITTRYHLGVLGLLWNKPVIVIDHELKMRSLAEDFGLPMVSLTEFVARGIPDIGALLRRFDRQRAAGALAQERGRVSLNFSWLG